MGPIFNTFVPGAGLGTPWARGLEAPGPKQEDTRGECNHLLSGKLPTVRQTTYCQASYLLSGMHPTAPYTCTQQPHTCTQEFPYTLHPTTAYFAPNRLRIHAPKFRIHAPRSFRIHAFNSACILKSHIHLISLIRLPIVLPIELPIVLPTVLPNGFPT